LDSRGSDLFRIIYNLALFQFRFLDLVPVAEARATLFYELSAKSGKTDRIPMVLMYRVFDEMIIEVNRCFMLALGFERMKLLGRTMLKARHWEPFQRVEFLRAFNQNRTLKEYPLELMHCNGTNRQLLAAA
jgi:hypothetical protein